MLLQRADAGHRQGHAEQTAPARLRAGLNVAAHQLDQRAADRQPQAGPAEAPGDGAIGLTEALEHAGRKFGAEADARILDFQRQQRRALPGMIVLNVHLDTDPAGLGEFDGIGQQIAQHLFDPGAVAEKIAARRRAALDHEIEALGLRASPHQIDDGIDLGSQVHLVNLDVQLAGLNLGDVEDIGHQPFQRDTGLFDQPDHLALPLRQAGPLQGCGDADNPVQRRADLVTHIGQEFTLGQAGCLGRLPGRGHFAFDRLAFRDVPRHGEDPCVRAPRPPFQLTIAAVGVAIAIDETDDLALRLLLVEPLHMGQRRLDVVRMNQRQQRSALQLIQGVAEHGLPGPVQFDEPTRQIANTQQIQRHIEEAGHILRQPVPDTRPDRTLVARRPFGHGIVRRSSGHRGNDSGEIGLQTGHPRSVTVNPTLPAREFCVVVPIGFRSGAVPEPAVRIFARPIPSAPRLPRPSSPEPPDRPGW